VTVDVSDPLSGHPQFSRWRRLRAWSAGTASFGSVVADLVDGIKMFAAEHPPVPVRRGESWPVALGCVMALTNPDVVEALARLGGCCVVVDKKLRHRKAVDRLCQEACGIPQVFLRDFDELAPPGPHGPTVICPSSPWPISDVTLGPARLAGWRPEKKGAQAPLLHSKLLVLGTAEAWEWDEEPGMGMNYKLTPKKAWLGSANWTEPSPNHLEFGVWTTDRELVAATFEFVTDVIAFSEPLDTVETDPTPELAQAVWDDAAFAEALADMPDEPEFEV
jgi:hypothetical protein